MFDRVHRAPDASPAACRAAVDAVTPGASVVALLVADQPGVDVEAIAAALGEVPVVGAVFPRLIDGATLVDRGALALALDAPSRRAIIPSTFEPPEILASMLGPALEPTGARAGSPTLLVLVDGHAPGSATALLDAIRLPYLHLAAPMIGGGAGFFSEIDPRPCLFTERGPLARGGGLVVRLEAIASVAIEHGWSPLAGPFLATKADNTTVRELDWRPAREVYGEALGSDAVPRVSLQHPLAVLGPGGSMSVRDLLSFTEDGGIFTFGQIDPRALIAILRAEPESLIGAAGAAARAAFLGAPRPACSSFVFDCVSRADALAERFGEELTRIHRESTTPLWGALSLGELASTGERAAAFHNKTVVVAAR